MQGRLQSLLAQSTLQTPRFQMPQPLPLGDPLSRSSSFSMARSSSRARGSRTYVAVVSPRDRTQDFSFELTRRTPLQITLNNPNSSPNRSSNPDLFLRSKTTGRLIGTSRRPTGFDETIQVRRNLPPGEYEVEVVLTSGETVASFLRVRAPRSPVLLAPDRTRSASADRMRTFLS